MAAERFKCVLSIAAKLRKRPIFGRDFVGSQPTDVVTDHERNRSRTSECLHRAGSAILLAFGRCVQSAPHNLAAKREIIQRLYQAETVLKGKTILIVDDDIRNIFAMTSLLERYEMNITSAETGKIALEQLQSKADIDAVLMDIMMPDMDGYDTMRAIRKFPKFRTLPMIAVTAKAMKGDRDKCIEAGASDYIAKPVDSAELLSMLRLWLHR